jgi:diamine N-acetyltransferase
MSTKTVLTPAGRDDAAAISAMAEEIWPTAYAHLISTEQIRFMLGWMYAPAELTRQMEEENMEYYWIETGNLHVGFLAIGPVLPGVACPLHKFYLLPERHREGLGSAAMDRLMSRLETSGATSIELRVNRSNLAAIGFYRKNGFVKYAEDCLEIGGGFVMDDYLMRRPLPR